jgi:hypothetical protein
MNTETYPSLISISTVLNALTVGGQTFDQLISKTGLSRIELRRILSMFLDECAVTIKVHGGVEFFQMQDGEFQVNPVPPPVLKPVQINLFGEI